MRLDTAQSMEAGDAPEGTSVRVRDACDADRPAVLALMRELQAFERALHPNRASPEDMAEEQLAFLENWAATSQGRVLVAERAGLVAGYAICGLDEAAGSMLLPDERVFGLIADLCVADGARGQGVGTALMQACEAHLDGLGVRQIQVCALAANADAIGFYEGRGWRPYYITFEKRRTDAEPQYGAKSRGGEPA